ncbi:MULTISPECIES: Rv3654c family TadE-like protein [Streptomyces]|uniref:Pilus assembly protein TadG-related protein n=3 Tax=Streptomyces TaxID=1883 RepID=A0ABU2RHF4_9ACTN|nr:MULTISPECIES: Rv3654c family TadE-like protein [unclassified Streptomyces]MDT0427920.1 pilus assembly protein TadG-related protein [Streptomyces sp. DSM 41770]
MATVWVAVTTATLCAVFAVVLALGQAVAARHEAAAAADLAALAAADRALLGAAEACEAAREVTGAQGAELVRCAVRGDIADVTARAHFGPYAPEARSRAGPPVAQTPGVPTVSVRLAGTGTGAGTTTGAHGELELPVTVTWTERRWPECLSA